MAIDNEAQWLYDRVMEQVGFTPYRPAPLVVPTSSRLLLQALCQVIADELRKLRDHG